MKAKKLIILVHDRSIRTSSGFTVVSNLVQSRSIHSNTNW